MAMPGARQDMPTGLERRESGPTVGGTIAFNRRRCCRLTLQFVVLPPPPRGCNRVSLPEARVCVVRARKATQDQSSSAWRRHWGRGWLVSTLSVSSSHLLAHLVEDPLADIGYNGVRLDRVRHVTLAHLHRATRAGRSSRKLWKHPMEPPHEPSVFFAQFHRGAPAHVERAQDTVSEL